MLLSSPPKTNWLRRRIVKRSSCTTPSTWFKKTVTLMMEAESNTPTCVLTLRKRTTKASKPKAKMTARTTKKETNSRTLRRGFSPCDARSLMSATNDFSSRNATYGVTWQSSRMALKYFSSGITSRKMRATQSQRTNRDRCLRLKTRWVIPNSTRQIMPVISNHATRSSASKQSGRPRLSRKAFVRNVWSVAMSVSFRRNDMSSSRTRTKLTMTTMTLTNMGTSLACV
mmetsp:Transcript_36739/g.83124  ORF Transcript_36739/g.83124 Transcript_36739/m.83124 type:complete len:228 (+) Transcript_36739:463-1146(+)